MNSGRARGGPYNTKMIHHAEPIYRLAVVASEDWMRALPGQCGPTENEPDVVFGSYVFQPALEEWIWDKRSVNPYRETGKTEKSSQSQDRLQE